MTDATQEARAVTLAQLERWEGMARRIGALSFTLDDVERQADAAMLVSEIKTMREQVQS